MTLITVPLTPTSPRRAPLPLRRLRCQSPPPCHGSAAGRPAWEPVWYETERHAHHSPTEKGQRCSSQSFPAGGSGTAFGAGGLLLTTRFHFEVLDHHNIFGSLEEVFLTVQRTLTLKPVWPLHSFAALFQPLSMSGQTQRCRLNSRSAESMQADTNCVCRAKINPYTRG